MATDSQTGPSMGEAFRQGERRIHRGDLEATIQAQGAYVSRLRTKEGVDLLFPLQEVDGKMRGTHVCLPNFGPDNHDLGLAQHGFARTETWQAGTWQDDGLELNLLVNEHTASPGSQHYDGLHSRLSFETRGSQGGGEASRFSLRLRLRNLGDQAMPVNPAFHPYFVIPPQEVGRPIVFTHPDRTYQINPKELAEPLTIAAGGAASLKIGDQVINLTTHNMPYTVLWTNRPDLYVCMEPVATYKELSPADSVDYSASFEWQSAVTVS